MVSSVMSDAICDVCDVCDPKRPRRRFHPREEKMYIYMSELMKKCFIDREVCEEE